jgi:hypothetical protein
MSLDLSKNLYFYYPFITRNLNFKFYTWMEYD